MNAMEQVVSPTAAPHCAACVSPFMNRPADYAPWARPMVAPQTTIDQTGEVIDIGFQTSAPSGPPGSNIISAFTYDTYWSLHDSPFIEDVQSLQYDFTAGTFMGQDVWHMVLDNIKAQLLQSNLQIIAYILWESVEIGASIPAEICIPGTTICWTPPFAGQNLAQLVNYRLWMMIIPFAGPMPMVAGAVAPFAFVIPIATILGLVFAFVVVTFTVILAWQILNGKMTLGQGTSIVKDILKTPGESFGPGSFTGPLIAFGITLIAAGIFVPMLSGGISAAVPIGPANVEAHAGQGAGGGGGRRRR